MTTSHRSLAARTKQPVATKAKLCRSGPPASWWAGPTTSLQTLAGRTAGGRAKFPSWRRRLGFATRRRPLRRPARPKGKVPGRRRAGRPHIGCSTAPSEDAPGRARRSSRSAGGPLHWPSRWAASSCRP
uniref:Uncharacterized protein n=1 Tax=Ixodes ricinus TaxID=34613 RepID=A0A6B0UQK1_IXORI